MSRSLGRLAESPANYWLGFVADLGGAAGFIAAGAATSGRSAAAALLALFAGLVTYTVYEYGFHRWLYHGPRSSIDFVHAIHHRRERARVGAPFFFPVAVCALTWLACSAVLDRPTAAVFAGSVLLGYGYQSVIHHLFHSRRFVGGGYLARLRAHHLVHHRDSSVNFGVITTGWDRIFRTRRAVGQPRAGARSAPAPAPPRRRDIPEPDRS